MAEANLRQDRQNAQVEYAQDPGAFFQALEKAVGAKSDIQKKTVAGAVGEIVRQALSNTQLQSAEALDMIQMIKAGIDRKLTEQVNLIIHHQEFQSLESAWRGLQHFVSNTETDETLKIRVINISKNELSRELKKFKGAAWDQSPLFRKLYEAEYGMPGGEPYGCIVADYFFDHSAPDVEILAGMAQIAAAAHAPLISAAAPSLLNMESWQQLGDPRDLTKIFQTADYAAWRSLRDSEDSRYLALTLPRFLARMPYGAKTNPVEGFDFEEDVEGADHSKYCWANSAYTMATNISRAFKDYGWCAAIRGTESGGVVQGLPCHTFPTDDGGVDMKCPTEIAITDRREAELSKNGMLPLSHHKNTDYAVFMGGQSVQKPAEYNAPQATANANLSARLPYLFAVCRFAHYLKCIVRDKVGSFKERDDMQKFLYEWIQQYVEPIPGASDEAKARKPLAAAEVVVSDVEGNPGYYTAKFSLRPHYQLEGMTISLSLVSKLPSGK